MDPPDQAGVAENAQSVVDRLVGDVAQLAADAVDDRVRVGVGMRVHCREDRDAGAGDPERGTAKQSLDVRSRHAAQYGT